MKSVCCHSSYELMNHSLAKDKYCIFNVAFAETWGVDWFCPEGTTNLRCNFGWYKCPCGEENTASVEIWCYASGGIAFCGWPDRAFAWYDFPTCPDLSNCYSCNDASVQDDGSSISCVDCVKGYEDPSTRCNTSRQNIITHIFMCIKGDFPLF